MKAKRALTTLFPVGTNTQHPLYATSTLPYPIPPPRPVPLFVPQVPPFQRRPSNGIEALKLPWDTLANDFVNRNPHMVEDSEWLGPQGFQPGAPPISHVFAKRQYALMQNGERVFRR